MKTIFVAATLFAAVASPAFAATEATAPAAPKMTHMKMKSHPMKAAAKPGAPVMHPAHDASTDKLNQQQLDAHKS